MTVSAVSLDLAESRLAHYYVNRLREASASLHQGPANRAYWVDRIRADWEQIIQCRAWSAGASGASDERARICVDFAATTLNVLQIMLTPGEHMRWAQQALAAARLVNDTFMEQELLYRAGFLGLTLETPDVAEDYSRQLLVLATQAHDPRHLGRAHFLMGAAAFIRGQYDETERCLESSMKALDRARSDPVMGQNWLGLGRIANLRGDYTQAKMYYRLYLDFSVAQGNAHAELEARMSMSGIHLALGEAALAEAFAVKTLEMARAYGTSRFLPPSLFGLAHAEKALDKLDQAAVHYTEGIQVARLIAAPSTIANGLHGLGQVRAKQGDIDAAIALLEEALDTARSAHILHRVGEVTPDLVYLHIQQGQLDLAQARLQKAVHIAMELNTPYFAAKALAAAILVWTARGEYEQAAVWSGLLMNNLDQLRPSLYESTIFEPLAHKLGATSYTAAQKRGKLLHFPEVMSEVSRAILRYSSPSEIT